MTSRDIGMWVGGTAGGRVRWWWTSRARLGDVLDSRDNNFDLIRLAAALLVLYGHSFFEAPDDTHADVVQWALGGAEYSGSIAVYTFFLVSGLLITASLERHRSALAFVVARFARIWPGFVVCIAVLLYGVIPLASGIGLRDPAHLKAAGACLRSNALFFVSGYCGSLPGAFPSTPMPGQFGFSYWTLPAEVHCYAMVLALGIAFGGRLTATRTAAVLFCMGSLAFCAVFLAVAARHPAETAPFWAEVTVMGGYASYPVLFFFAGMILYAARRRIVVDGGVALALAIVALVLPQPNLLIYPALAYGILALAAERPLRRIKPRHDLSYGIYIYGTAMQQVARTLTGPEPASVNFVVSAGLSASAAYLSWRLVEAPAIALGRRVTRCIDGRRGRDRDAKTPETPGSAMPRG